MKRWASSSLASTTWHAALAASSKARVFTPTMSFIGWWWFSESVEPEYTASLARPHTGPPATIARTSGASTRSQPPPQRRTG